MSKIPKFVKLAGMTINVIFDNTLYAKKRMVAEARYPEQIIALDPTIMTKEGMVQSYYHELMHHIFFILGEGELRANEKIVDTIAHLLHQAHQSTEFYDFGEKDENNCTDISSDPKKNKSR